eukprot:TRINITY_DN6437_c0_g2_i1.p1 TRINITY_DN6437_c0_g2~~TRINITY_DN6437_c0_g2_i1.p1  ORF type:complete len:150 (+),score=23.58 TRINITY_DN6437_c0_g2_i1:50-499(+)
MSSSPNPTTVENENAKVTITPVDEQEGETKELPQYNWDWSIYSPKNIPCFRSSLLVGIGSGFAVGLVTLLKGLRNPNIPRTQIFAKTQLFFTSTLCITASIYWGVCRYNYKLRREQIRVFMDTQIEERNRENEELLNEIDDDKDSTQKT